MPMRLILRAKPEQHSLRAAIAQAGDDMEAGATDWHQSLLSNSILRYILEY